jgi:hypothetical protein
MIDSWRDTIFFLGVVVLFPLSLARALIESPAKKLTKDALPMAHTLLVVRMNND